MLRRSIAVSLLISLLACTGDSSNDDVADELGESEGDSSTQADAGTTSEGETTSDADATATSNDSTTDDATSTTDDSTTTTTDSTTGEGDCELADIIDQSVWDAMFLHEDDPACFGSVYTLQGLLDAAADFPGFACEGDDATRRRELAAFLAQISHETTGGWPAAPDGPYAWGLCFIEEVGCQNNACPQYCDAGNLEYPCAPGKTYHGRGAIQLSWNYNYGRAGDALGVDLLSDPDLVKNDSKLAIQTAMWFWMTEQPPKPSAHDVMAGNWQPSGEDQQLGRLPGFGMTTNIINGGLECAQPGNPKVADRIGFFERYTGMLGTDMGDNVDCDMMTPY
ncbi:glycoside hydrolase family 19 protein [Nannocystaceae bacterium ST9]